MLSFACAILFAAAAASAIAAIASTLRTYTGDVIALNASRHQPTRFFDVTWRVGNTGGPVDGEATSLADLSSVLAGKTFSRARLTKSGWLQAGSPERMPTPLAA